MYTTQAINVAPILGGPVSYVFASCVFRERAGLVLNHFVAAKLTEFSGQLSL